MPAWMQLDAVRMRHGQPRDELRMTFPHTLQERKGPFTCPRCGEVAIRFIQDDAYGPAPVLEHDDKHEWECTWLDEATDEQVEALK